MMTKDLISYDQWMKETYSLTSPRSALLKALDAAIKTGDRDAIKVALDRWRFDQSRQGKKWQDSVRNGKGSVTQLHRAVNDHRKLSKEELEAFDYIARAQALALQKQFLGKTLTFKQGTLAGLANKAGGSWERFKRDAPTVASAAADAGGIALSARKGVVEAMTGAATLQQGGRAAAVQAAQASTSASIQTIKQKVRSFCAELCPGIDVDHVFRALNLGGLETFAHTITPFIGAISSGGKALAGWAGVAANAYKLNSVQGTRYAFAPGDPEAAFDAVVKLMEREIASGSARAGVKTVAFTGKLLGTFADGGALTGPLLGLAELLAEVMQQVVEYVREYKECQAANEMLRIGALNLDLFSVSPVLGCYFLVVQDHSTIINFAIGDYGTPNWMYDVEKLVAKAQAALEKARLCIAASRYEIVGLSNAKGVVGPNWSHRGTLDKITSAKDEVQDQVLASVEGWLNNPVKQLKVDKSRIVGFGSNVVDKSRIVGFGSNVVDKSRIVGFGSTT